MRGFNRRLKVLEDQVTYTIGEGDSVVTDAPCDIAIAGGENTVPDQSSIRAVKVGNVVYLDGSVMLDGANATLTFTLPAGFRPSLAVSKVVRIYDDSAGVFVLGYCNVGTDGVVIVGTESLAALAADDVIDFGCSFLVAE